MKLGLVLVWCGATQLRIDLRAWVGQHGHCLQCMIVDASPGVGLQEADRREGSLLTL